MSKHKNSTFETIGRYAGKVRESYATPARRGLSDSGLRLKHVWRLKFEHTQPNTHATINKL